MDICFVAIPLGPSFSNDNDLLPWRFWYLLVARQQSRRKHKNLKGRNMVVSNSVLVDWLGIPHSKWLKVHPLGL